MKLPFRIAGLSAILWFSACSSWATIGIEYQMALGNPSGATVDSSNHTHYLIQRLQYAMDYNDTNHQANWVSWSYTSGDTGSTARQDSFRTDTSLPSGFLRIGSATFDTGYDRGHMCPSGDRTASVADNDATFLMSNMIPQTSVNNQGLWATFEAYCRALASGGNEILITCGPGDFGTATISNGMKLPGSVWKVIVVVPPGTGTAASRITTSCRVIAINTPNASTGLGTWQSYITSVEEIEAATGFRFFSAVTPSVATYLKNVVDTGTGPNSPTVVTSFSPISGSTGTTVTISGYNFGSAPVVKFNGVTAVASVQGGGTQINATVPAGATTGEITVTGTGGTDITTDLFTISGANSPALLLSVSSLSGFSAAAGTASSSQSYTVSGSNLTGAITVAAPADYEISLNNSSYASSQNLNPTSGTLSATPVYVRLSSLALAGSPSGLITHTGGGAISQNLTVAGTVTSLVPALSLSTSSMTGFSTPLGTASSSQSYTLSGSNLAGNVVVAAPTGYELSLDNSSFGVSRTLVPVGGNISVSVYVRLSTTAALGSVAGTVTHIGGGATSVDLSVSGTVLSNTPTLNLSLTTLSGFSAVFGLVSSSQNYTVSGTNLTGDITITAPANFEISLSSASGYLSSMILSPSAGVLAPRVVYVRIAASTPVGVCSGSLAHAGGGTTTQDISLSGVVYASGGTDVTLAKWTFESATISSTGSMSASFSPEDGTQTSSASAVGVHSSASTVYSSPSGNGSAKSFSANNWTVGDYYQFKLNTLGYGSLKVGVDCNSSGTGPAEFTLAYSTDGTTFTDFTNYNVPRTNSVNITWSNSVVNTNSTLSFNLSSIPSLSNQSNVVVRLKQRSTVSLANGVVASTGTSRVDNVTFLASLLGGGPPVVTSTNATSGNAYEAFTFQVVASNSPAFYEATGLPSGLTINSIDGLISGIPTVPGIYSVTLTAGNSAGNGTANLSLTIAQNPGAPTITSPLVVAGILGAPFSYQITGTHTPASYSASNLPTGLSIDTSSGLISGTPSASGTKSVQITASNSLGTVTKILEITISEPSMTLSVGLLSGFSTISGTASASQSYILSGSNLTGAITVTAPPGYEISLNQSSYASSQTLTPVGNILSGVTIYVRLTSFASVGSPIGFITHIGGGALEQDLEISGLVNPNSPPTISSSLYGAAYVGVAFTYAITVSGTPIMTDYNAVNLPIGLTVNRTTGVISGTPSVAGTSIITLSATSTTGTANSSYTLNLLSQAQQDAIPFNVVVNKFLNGTPDKIELLVVGNSVGGPKVDMRGMILKDFSSSMASDNGGKFIFADHPLWASVKAGTLIVLSAGATEPEDVEPSDFILRVNLDNTTYFTNVGGGFSVENTDMILLKAANTGTDGVAGGIHGLAVGSAGTQYNLYKGKRLRSTRTMSSSRGYYAYALNSSSLISDYYPADGTGATTTTSLTFGLGNGTANTAFIISLRNLDQTGPVLSLLGSNPMTVAHGFSYAEPGATASDAKDGTRAVTVSGSVNSSLVGPYLITYTASDISGNTSTTTRVVNVTDQTAPLITLNGAATLTIPAGGSYSEAGATATDAVDGSLTVTISGSVNTSVVGTYVLTYNATDAGGNTGMVNRTIDVISEFDYEMANTYGLSGSQASPTADPDFDGFSNLTEYAFGTSPVNAGGTIVNVLPSTGGTVKVSYLQKSGVTYTVRSATSLGTGFSGTVEPSLSVTQPAGLPIGYNQYEATFTSGGDKGFLKVDAVVP